MIMRAVTAPLLLTVLTTGLLTCCAGGSRVVEQSFDVHVSHRFDGPAVDIENARGEVTVRVNPRVEEASVEVVARHTSGLSAEDEQRMMDGMMIEQARSVDGGPETLVVRVPRGDWLGDELRFDVRVTLPACSGLRVLNSGGDVRVTGVGGAIHVENEGGAIEVRTSEPMRSPVALTTKGGNVYYQVPVTSRQRIDMATERGKASLDATHPSVRVTDFSSDGTRVTATINGGDAPALLRSDTGRVRAWFIADPEGLVRTDP